nr:hypothetical protein [uncultured Carboxylicivirga sp.]
MTQKMTIFISALLIIAAVIIELLLKDTQTTMDTDLIGFFAGILFGMGIGMPLTLFVKKKNVNTDTK